MTQKQLQFCKEYNETKDMIQAYQNAYKCTETIAKQRAEKLLASQEVQEYLNLTRKEIVSSDFIILHLKDIVINSTKEADKLKALELLAKYSGLFANNEESELVIKIDY